MAKLCPSSSGGASVEWWKQLQLMKALLLCLCGLSVLLAGCNQAGNSSGDSGPATEIEGTYYDPSNPDISLVIKNGQYKQGADDIHAAGSFTARKTASNKWELDIVHTGRLAGEKTTLLVRKEGKDLIVGDKEMGSETTFKRK